MNHLIFLFLSLAVAGCSSFRAIRTTELDRSQLVGKWKGVTRKAELEIYCSGAFSYKVPNKLNHGSTQSKGSVINKINDSSFEVGPIWKTNFDVQTWPYKKNGTMYMVVEGVEYYRTEPISCTNY